MSEKLDVLSTSLPDVVPGNYLLSPSEMHWGPVEANGLHRRAIVTKPILTGLALGLWLKYADSNRTGFVTYDHDHPLAAEHNGFYAKLDNFREALLQTDPETGVESTHHVMRSIGRVLLNQDRYQPCSLPLTLKKEEEMLPRAGGMARVEEFMLISHDLSMNLDTYVAQASHDQAA